MRLRHENPQRTVLEISVPAPYLWRPWFIRSHVRPGHNSFIRFLDDSGETYPQAGIWELPVKAVTTVLFPTNQLRKWFQLPQTPASKVVQWVKNPPAMQEMRVLSLGWEDPLEESVATHLSILARRVPWTEEPGGLQSIRLQRVGHDKWLSMQACHKQVNERLFPFHFHRKLSPGWNEGKSHSLS